MILASCSVRFFVFLGGNWKIQLLGWRDHFLFPHSQIKMKTTYQNTLNNINCSFFNFKPTNLLSALKQ